MLLQPSHLSSRVNMTVEWNMVSGRIEGRGSHVQSRNGIPFLQGSHLSCIGKVVVEGACSSSASALEVINIIGELWIPLGGGVVLREGRWGQSKMGREDVESFRNLPDFRGVS